MWAGVCRRRTKLCASGERMSGRGPSRAGVIEEGEGNGNGNGLRAQQERARAWTTQARASRARAWATRAGPGWGTMC